MSIPYDAALAASSGRCTSVTTGTLKSSRIRASISSPFSSPIPVKESYLERLAFLYDALKIRGISYFALSPHKVSAMERVIITYPKERIGELCALLGLPTIEKIVYRLDELLPTE